MSARPQSTRSIRGAWHHRRGVTAAHRWRAIPVLTSRSSVLFHTWRVGMTPCKVMKESFSRSNSRPPRRSLQYGREFWVCADLWGPISAWFTARRFAGHSPQSSDRLCAWPISLHRRRCSWRTSTCLCSTRARRLCATEYGEVWREFREDFVPANLCTGALTRRMQTSCITPRHCCGRNEPFGATATGPDSGQRESRGICSARNIQRTAARCTFRATSFRVALNGTPRDSCHFDIGAATNRLHGLFTRAQCAGVRRARARRTLGQPQLILAVGSRLPGETLALLRGGQSTGRPSLCRWLTAEPWSRTETVGAGQWVVSTRSQTTRCWLQPNRCSGARPVDSALRRHRSANHGRRPIRRNPRVRDRPLNAGLNASAHQERRDDK